MKYKISDNKIPFEVIVTNILHKVGIPASLKGYHYLRYAILLCIKNDGVPEKFTENVYNVIAAKYNTTSPNVRKAMAAAISISWDRGDIDTLNSFFGYTVDTAKGKPTNIEFISLITDKILLKYGTLRNLYEEI